MEQSPSWEANRFSASPRILWNPKIHYRIQKRPHLLLSWGRSIHSTPPSHFLKTHFNIIHPLFLDLASGIVPSSFPTKTLYAPLLSHKRATWPAHLILDLITLQYLVRNTDHKAPHYVVLSSSLLPLPSYAQRSSSAPLSRTPSPSVQKTTIHAHKKKKKR